MRTMIRWWSDKMGTSEDVWVVDGVWWVWYCSARTHNEQRHLKYNTYLTWSVVLCWKRRKNHAVRPFVRHRIDPFAGVSNKQEQPKRSKQTTVSQSFRQGNQTKHERRSHSHPIHPIQPKETEKENKEKVRARVKDWLIRRFGSQ